ncbi:hypothetical protein Zm00014a_027355 [Zea mays]|uniref:Uncharacterized protein n=1 Tax=Zea mays TaxID=4577 RepID=A0A3L6FTS1_MAIZE|nr:hypothetical protein Zm00014a_027355 [Zea mays]
MTFTNGRLKKTVSKDVFTLTVYNHEPIICFYWHLYVMNHQSKYHYH